MRFSLRRKKSGVFFAIWPRRTVDGELWNGWLHWERVLIPGWGWGSGDEYIYRYTRWEDRLRTLRAQFYKPPELEDLYTRVAAVAPLYYPKEFCTNYWTSEPTPCNYPNCRWTDKDGTQRCCVDHVAFGEM